MTVTIKDTVMVAIIDDKPLIAEFEEWQRTNNIWSIIGSRDFVMERQGTSVQSFHAKHAGAVRSFFENRSKETP